MKYADRRRAHPDVPEARHFPSALESPPMACAHFDWLVFACGFLSGWLAAGVAILLVALIGGC